MANENFTTTETVETPVASTKKTIRIVGAAAVLTSSMKLADLKTIKTYEPKALQLLGGEDGKETVFMIDIADEGYGGYCGNMGIMFAPKTTDANGYATVTVMIPDGTEKPAEWFVNNYGAAVMKLNELEATLPAVLGKLSANKKAVLDAIEIG